MTNQEQSEITPADSPKPVVRRVVDPGGDGRRAQVFEAENLEGLVDELVKSTEHGSKHIRQLEAENRALRSKIAETGNPDAVMFVANHSDYENEGDDGERNGELMRMKLADLGLPANSENLHKAYLALKKSRLLALKDEKRKEATRTEQPRADVAPRGRRVSTISTHSRATAVPVSTDPSEAELYRMPIDELKDLANKQLRTPSSVT